MMTRKSPLFCLRVSAYDCERVYWSIQRLLLLSIDHPFDHVLVTIHYYHLYTTDSAA